MPISFGLKFKRPKEIEDIFFLLFVIFKLFIHLMIQKLFEKFHDFSNPGFGLSINSANPRERTLLIF